MNRLIIAFASVGFIGYCPLAPGTVGTLAGVFLFYLFSCFDTSIFLLTVTAIFFLACWASQWAEIILGEKDSPKIVIDEVIGYLIAMALLPPTFAMMAGGFVFFRILDIMKPPPARQIDRNMKGGLGVVLDDVTAGIYTNIILRALLYWRPELFYAIDRIFTG